MEVITTRLWYFGTHHQEPSSSQSRWRYPVWQFKFKHLIHPQQMLDLRHLRKYRGCAGVILWRQPTCWRQDQAVWPDFIKKLTISMFPASGMEHWDVEKMSDLSDECRAEQGSKTLLTVVSRRQRLECAVCIPNAYRFPYHALLSWDGGYLLNVFIQMLEIVEVSCISVCTFVDYNSGSEL